MITNPPGGAKVAFFQLSAGRFQIAVALIIRLGLMNLPASPLDGQDFILKKICQACLAHNRNGADAFNGVVDF